ncbi:FUSC-like inner membrane yccS family protein, partial [Vibrio parahaemolyticus V-223/04]
VRATTATKIWQRSLSVQTCCSALNIFLRHKRKLAGILLKPFNSATNTLTPMSRFWL